MFKVGDRVWVNYGKGYYGTVLTVLATGYVLTGIPGTFFGYTEYTNAKYVSPAN